MSFRGLSGNADNASCGVYFALEEPARIHRNAGRFETAWNLYAQSLAEKHRTKGGYHRDTLRARSRLANTFYAAGRHPEAIRWFRDILARRSGALGPDHPDTLRSKSSLANAYLASGCPRQAARLHRETLEARARVLGRSHVRTRASNKRLTTALGRLTGPATASPIWVQPGPHFLESGV